MDKADWTSEYSPLLRGIDNRRRLLPGNSLVQKWKHRGLSGEKARCQPIRSGQFIQVNPLLTTLTCTHEQLTDAARGLRFMHQNRVIHGTLRPVRETSFSLIRFGNGVNRVVY